ncbi:MAG: hypothetical protein AAF449_22795 [Myxococcota bacterium]
MTLDIGVIGSMTSRELTISIFALVLSSACSSAETPAFGTEGAPCPNDNNCFQPLQCVEGFCRAVAPGPDAGAPDGGQNPVVFLETFNSGPLQTTPDGQELGFTLTGSAAIVRESTGYTDVRVEISGLTPNTEFTAHVHAKACNDEGGGPHYKIDDTVEEVIEENEIWPSITPGPDAWGYGRIRVSHYARPEAQSIVIHEPLEGRRIACFDLNPNADVTATGTFNAFPNAAIAITGTAELRRYAGGSVASVSLNGPLPPNTVFPIHVHAKACNDESGGPHYLFDTTIVDAIEENELWPDATVDATGNTATGSASAPEHIARFDAVSMVIHDPDTGERLACADLQF